MQHELVMQNILNLNWSQKALENTYFNKQLLQLPINHSS